MLSSIAYRNAPIPGNAESARQFQRGDFGPKSRITGQELYWGERLAYSALLLNRGFDFCEGPAPA